VYDKLIDACNGQLILELNTQYYYFTIKCSSLITSPLLVLQFMAGLW
jgi:hypothetical protein